MYHKLLATWIFLSFLISTIKCCDQCNTTFYSCSEFSITGIGSMPTCFHYTGDPRSSIQIEVLVQVNETRVLATFGPTAECMIHEVGCHETQFANESDFTVYNQTVPYYYMKVINYLEGDVSSGRIIVRYPRDLVHQFNVYFNKSCDLLKKMAEKKPTTTTPQSESTQTATTTAVDPSEETTPNPGETTPSPGRSWTLFPFLFGQNQSS